ncbi:DUF6048 family protein [Fulvivirga sedimenti]|uniref:DUF6048 family protein n=1 Tax=Fulvivirga sedimenti TaxID=2879465 RepID=A0A9X1HX46_9BACT|nr:DUF6048 family protein [Fulvivirga sedimenti]MCA6078985.1 DUF6048 family protein [Fulvivirga sedimenti]
MRIYRYTISLLLLVWLAIPVMSQEIILYPDSARGKFKPTGLTVGVDLISGAKTFIRDDLDWLNFYAGIDIYKYTFNVEYGQEYRKFESGSSVYEADGSYFRIGPDINFLFRDPDRSALFMGLRYAFNSFSDELSYELDDPFWGQSQQTLQNPKLKANWFELVAGMRVKLFQAVWMGYTGRFKFAVTTFEDQPLIPQHVPGYGRADLRSTWEFNYWLIFRLPLSKPPSTVVIPSSLPRTE